MTQLSLRRNKQFGKTVKPHVKSVSSANVELATTTEWSQYNLTPSHNKTCEVFQNSTRILMLSNTDTFKTKTWTIWTKFQRTSTILGFFVHSLVVMNRRNTAQCTTIAHATLCNISKEINHWQREIFSAILQCISRLFFPINYTWMT